MTRFIDVHVHPPVPELLDGPFAPFLPQLELTFRRPIEAMSPSEIAELYRARDGRAVLLAWDAMTATGRPGLSNETVAEMVADHPDVFLGFGSIDPHQGAAALTAIGEAVRLGLIGLKFHPPAQRFAPNDRRFYPIWELAEELGVPVLSHTGFTGLGAGMRAGGGVRLGHGRPILWDEVAADFPELIIVLAHPSWPWQDEAIAVARHKPNVYLELSGWSPKYLASSLLEAVTSDLSHRTLFGTDFPFITPDKWLGDWEALGIDPDISRRVLHDNAAELFGSG